MLITSDIHLDNNPENDYRWGLLPWIIEQCEEYKIKNVLILGDLTTSKDRHNAILVNRFFDQLSGLNKYANVYLLQGNHDAITPEWPFFGFVSELSHVTFIGTPTMVELHNSGICYFLPATKTPEQDWKGLDFKYCDYIFTHQTYKGTIAETGFPLPGVDPSIFGETNAKIYSGDIHFPGKIKGTNIEYVGAPYRTAFGDRYTPRCILIDSDGGVRDLRYPCPNKILLDITQLADLRDPPEEINPGDLIKIRMHLRRADYITWPELKQEIINYVSDKGCILHGKPELTQLVEAQTITAGYIAHRSAKELVSNYAERQNFSEETTQIGLKILEEADG